MHLTKQNKKAMDALLAKTLKKIFAKVDLCYDEWDIDLVSFEKVRDKAKASPLKVLKQIRLLSKEYDNLFEVAEALKVRTEINPDFVLFKNLFGKIK